MASTRERGTLGEEFACERLHANGYEILTRNFRAGKAEIDIVAQQGDVIAFVEVKLRCEQALVAPAGSVSRAQRRRIALAAVAYLRARGIYNTGEYQPRFDVFEIVTERAGSSQITRYAHLAAAYDTGDLHVFI